MRQLSDADLDAMLQTRNGITTSVPSVASTGVAGAAASSTASAPASSGADANSALRRNTSLQPGLVFYTNLYIDLQAL